MSARRSEESKAAALAALLQGQSVNQVAKEYNLPVGTVKSWKRKEAKGLIESSPKKDDVGALVMSYLEANLRALEAQVKVFQDAEWLKKQNAADVAVLHGVMTDKAIRLLEAMSKNE